jgi:hypothetical protein
MKAAKKAEDKLERGIKVAIAALNATLIVVSLRKALKKKKKDK